MIWCLKILLVDCASASFVSCHLRWVPGGFSIVMFTVVVLADNLTSHFKKYGEITDAVIMKDRSTGHPRGFGFVTFADPVVCDRVVLDKHVIDGRTVSDEYLSCTCTCSHIRICSSSQLGVLGLCRLHSLTAYSDVGWLDPLVVNGDAH